MRFEFDTPLPVPPEVAARLVDDPAAFAWLTAPVLRTRPLDPVVPGPRFRGGPNRVAARLFGVLPTGDQVIDVAWPEPDSGATHVLLDTGGNAFTRRYRHEIRILPDAGGSRCVDVTEVDAGPLTPLVGLGFRLVNAVVARRWRRLCALATRD